jgi:hypothetical protein
VLPNRVPAGVVRLNAQLSSALFVSSGFIGKLTGKIGKYA